MIWYILYPYRGTTEPPRLLPSHPIRRAFQAYGTATARHWLLSIFVTIAVSVLLCYPAVFKTDSPAAAGLRNLPKHVWTSTTEVERLRPHDVEVRQVWIQGDYMNAIEPRVLREALHVQEALIRSGFHDLPGADLPTSPASHHISVGSDAGCVNGAASTGWGVHSPLMYWNCSLGALERDQDLLYTINSKSKHHTPMNLTLRPSTVFAGKVFSNTKLQAADALVLTLFDQRQGGIGHIWDARAQQLAKDLGTDWSIFPPDGIVANFRAYEFRFKPMTLVDDLILAASYMVMGAYVIFKMMQLRAVKSWFGLLITICAKMTVCVIASFTVCTYLGINLGRIPRPWFPGVVFCFGLGNIFRLINVVLETPPELPPHQRIGNAIGEVGHLSLAVAGQNLLLIWLCSRIVTPWVADFCVFAAVTLVLDFVYHLTFFLAVLSVDVQRMELSDSLEQIDFDQASMKSRQGRQTWIGALRKGNLPFSTRFAGSAAILSIIIALNWHFFDMGGRELSMRAVRDKLLLKKTRSVDGPLWSPPAFKQARTPADWLRIQDHNTAKELFGMIKPNAHSFVARVYDPILIVLKEAEGRDTSSRPANLIEGLRKFAQGHAFPVALMVVFLIAGVTLLMNYLLWTGLPEFAEAEEDEDSMFSVKTLPTPQTLDVVRLISCPKGHLASISLDRSTSIWFHGTRGYTQSTLQTATMKPKLWPIVASAIDDNGTTLALCTDGGQIGLWSLVTTRFLIFPSVDLRGQAPTLFSFTMIPGTEQDKLSLIIVTPDGYLTELEAKTGIHRKKRICSSSILSATLFPSAKGEMNLVYVNKTGEVHIVQLNEHSQWSSEVVAGLDPGPPPGRNPFRIKCIQGLPALGLIFALRAEEVEIFDFNSRALIHSFQIAPFRSNSFRVMHSSRRMCHCGAPAIHSLCIAYSEQETNHLIMQTFTLDDSPTSQICLGKPSENEAHKCKGLDCATESVHYVEPAGAWESTSALSVVGIRRVVQSPTPSSTASGVDSGYFAAEPSALASALKQRATKQGRMDTAFGTRYPPASPGDTDSWEAWTLSSTGEFRARPLVSELGDEDADPLLMTEQLFVAAPGPITRLGKQSVAVGFGNTVKIITLGKESFDGLSTLENGLGLGGGGYRARRGTGRKVQ